MGDNPFTWSPKLRVIVVDNPNSYLWTMPCTTRTRIVLCPAEKKEDIVIPDSAKSVDGYAFYECKGLESISFPERLESIGECAFKGCKELESTELLRSVTFIRDGAFAWCWNLKAVMVSYKIELVEWNKFPVYVEIIFYSKSVPWIWWPQTRDFRQLTYFFPLFWFLLDSNNLRKAAICMEIHSYYHCLFVFSVKR